MTGTVIGWKDTPTSEKIHLVFEEEVGKGGYIQYRQGEDTVIARISEVFKVNEYFEEPESISEAIKSDEELADRFPVDEWEVAIGEAMIMGKFTKGMIKRVNSAPAPGKKVEKADTERIRRFLGLDDEGLTIGEVQQQGIDATFDMTDTLQKHFALLAQSGAGKSYTASVLIEELLDSETSPAVLAVDPHGDYTCFADDENYMDRTRVFNQKNIQIAVNNLSAEQIGAFFNNNMSEPQRQELSSVFKKLKGGENNDFGLEELRERVERKEMNSKVKYALLRKIRQLESMHIFGKADSPAPSDIEPGKLNIIDLSDVINQNKKQIIAGYFGKHFFKLRRQGRVPPFLYLIEEAHNFAPDSTPSPSKSIIEKLAREGRKFHACLGLISQRPVRLSTTALSQCNTQFILRVTNPNDLEHIAQSSEGITADVKDQIPSLKTGESIVIGEAVNYPTFVDVRERRSKESEAGEGLENALEEWFSEREKKKKDAEAFM